MPRRRAPHPAGPPAPVTRRRAGGVAAALLAAGLSGAVIVPSSAVTVQAQEPFDLPGELVDEAGVLGDTGELVAAQDAFAGRTGLQLFVVVVDDFEGSSASAWLERTAGLSGLGEQDLAVAVSVDDADAAARIPEGSGLRPGEVDPVVEQMRAQARAGDPQGAVDTAVTGLTALDPVDPAERARTIAAWTVGILLALVVLLAGGLWWRRRRARARSLAEAGRRAEELSAQLGSDVVALDQELEDTRIRVELAGAEVDAAATAQARSELASGELEAFDVHRARADLSIGPADDPTWRRPVTEVVTELERLRGLAASAREHLADARDALPH